MCLPKPKVDPNVAILAKKQAAEIAAQKAEVLADITEQKQEDKDLAITDRAAKKLRRRGKSTTKRYSLLNTNQAAPSNLGQRFS
jgi:alkanesulfonate monooxygenase SsuD/methylene tetrahydromethanopterin reductase-like flavin-dependent oxidoreductase (luciferase family)